MASSKQDLDNVLQTLSQAITAMAAAVAAALQKLGTGQDFQPEVDQINQAISAVNAVTQQAQGV